MLAWSLFAVFRLVVSCHLARVCCGGRTLSKHNGGLLVCSFFFFFRFVFSCHLARVCWGQWPWWWGPSMPGGASDRLGPPIKCGTPPTARMCRRSPVTPPAIFR